MTQHMCEYYNCDKEATSSEEYGKEVVWLCEDHFLNDDTGYCGLSCQLGYGCSQEC